MGEGDMGGSTPMSRDTCQSCGVPFVDHLGIEGTCAKLQRFRSDYVTYSKADVDTAIKRVLARFDFGRVHQVMHVLDWRWHGEDEPPTMGAIYQHAERLLRDAAESATQFCASGGFAADCRHGCASLQFILEDWDEDIGDEE